MLLLFVGEPLEKDTKTKIIAEIHDIVMKNKD